MSVLIKGMNAPYGCANCDFVGSPVYDSKGRAIYSCDVPVDGISGKNVTEQVINMYEGGGGDYFPEWCPLVDLGKHGDLMDKDAFKSDYGMKDDCADCEKESRGKVKACEYDRIYSKMDFCSWLDVADTIVEAEGE